jgi:hypothetical protein
MNNSDYITIYDNLSKKYNLKIIVNDETNHINLEIETFINNLNKDNTKIKSNYLKVNTQNEQSNVTGTIYLSKRLLNFLLASDFIINSTVEYTKLHTQIRSIIDYYHFKNVKNTDNEIYNELKNIIQANHIIKGKLITNFIKMYTSVHDEIKIDI